MSFPQGKKESKVIVVDSQADIAVTKSLYFKDLSKLNFFKKIFASCGFSNAVTSIIESYTGFYTDVHYNKFQDREIVKKLKDSAAKLGDLKREVHPCIKNGYIELACYLFKEKGLSVDEKYPAANEKMMVPLQMALESKQFGMVRLLIFDLYANVTLPGLDGVNNLAVLAAKARSRGILFLLFDRGLHCDHEELNKIIEAFEEDRNSFKEKVTQLFFKFIELSRSVDAGNVLDCIRWRLKPSELQDFLVKYKGKIAFLPIKMAKLFLSPDLKLDDLRQLFDCGPYIGFAAYEQAWVCHYNRGEVLSLEDASKIENVVKTINDMPRENFVNFLSETAFDKEFVNYFLMICREKYPVRNIPTVSNKLKLDVVVAVESCDEKAWGSMLTLLVNMGSSINMALMTIEIILNVKNTDHIILFLEHLINQLSNKHNHQYLFSESHLVELKNLTMISFCLGLREKSCDNELIRPFVERNKNYLNELFRSVAGDKSNQPLVQDIIYLFPFCYRLSFRAEICPIPPPVITQPPGCVVM